MTYTSFITVFHATWCLKCWIPVFFKEHVRYLVWTCRDPISLIIENRWKFSLILGTRFLNSRDPNRVHKRTKKTCKYIVKETECWLEVEKRWYNRFGSKLHQFRKDLNFMTSAIVCSTVTELNDSLFLQISSFFNWCQMQFSFNCLKWTGREPCSVWLKSFLFFFV